MSVFGGNTSNCGYFFLQQCDQTLNTLYIYCGWLVESNQKVFKGVVKINGKWSYVVDPNILKYMGSSNMYYIYFATSRCFAQSKSWNVNMIQNYHVACVDSPPNWVI